MLCPSQITSINNSSPSLQPFVSILALFLNRKRKKNGQVVYAFISLYSNEAGLTYDQHFKIPLGGFRPIKRHFGENQLDWLCNWVLLLIKL